LIDLDKSLDELGIDDIPPGLTSIEKQATVRDLLMSRSGVYREAAAVVVVPELILAIGDIYGGGKVAYIFEDGDTGYVSGEQHGLIAATEDQSTGIQWRNGSYQIQATGATDIAIGTGYANTELIISVQGPIATDYAAGLARDYAGGEYHDWFLPSHLELHNLYLNRVAIGGFSTGMGLGSHYWSSTEASGMLAREQNFNTGYAGYDTKKTINQVRAVRAF